MIDQSLHSFIEQMPKVELHVHLEGATQPEVLLELASRNGVTLPCGTTVDELRKWYTFRDFPHFIEIYIAISKCIQTAADIEYVAREFLKGQAAQNIQYSEVTFTPYTHFSFSKISFEDQITALENARNWAKHELQIDAGWVLDISRNVRPIEHGITVAQWVIASRDRGVVALGLGGPEVGHPPELFTQAFNLVREAGMAAVPHAGETEGAASIWGSLNALGAVRIGHGVRCLEDPELVKVLVDNQIPLEVSPSSNVCLGVVKSLNDHPLPRLIDEGLLVTINSDDPPMFNTTLTDEYLRIADVFGMDRMQIKNLVLNAVRNTLIPDEGKHDMEQKFLMMFDKLEA